MSQFTLSVFPLLSSSPPRAVAMCKIFLNHFGNHSRTSVCSHHPELCGARVHFLLMSEFMSRRRHELKDPCESLHPSPVIRMVSFHYELNQPPVTLSASWCLRLSVMVVGVFVFFAISWTCFQLPLPPPASHTCSTSLASFLFLRPPPSSPPPGRSGLAASYLSVKALVPQMPKLLKSLFPARDDKKELRPSPHSQQVSRGRCSRIAVIGPKYIYEAYR